MRPEEFNRKFPNQSSVFNYLLKDNNLLAEDSIPWLWVSTNAKCWLSLGETWDVYNMHTIVEIQR